MYDTLTCGPESYCRGAGCRIVVADGLRLLQKQLRIA